MTVIVLQRASASVRGRLSRWLLEVHPGVFVGRLPARVRDEIWARLVARPGRSAGLLLYTEANEQGFCAKRFGQTDRELFENEGLILVRRPEK